METIDLMCLVTALVGMALELVLFILNDCDFDRMMYNEEDGKSEE